MVVYKGSDDLCNILEKRLDVIVQHIRASYDLIADHERILLGSDRPEERNRTERQIQHKKADIETWLRDYSDIWDYLQKLRDQTRSARTQLPGTAQRSLSSTHGSSARLL